MLTDEGVPKITDFGLAKKLDEAGQTHSGAILGTPSYMATEQAGSGAVGLGPSADVYALGTILYELAVAFSAEGRLLATAGDDRTLRLWNAETLEKLCVFPAQNSSVLDVAFSPDGAFLAIAGVEEQVTVWDMKALRKTLADLQLDWE